jgi:hypothetical protein
MKCVSERVYRKKIHWSQVQDVPRATKVTIQIRNGREKVP